MRPPLHAVRRAAVCPAALAVTLFATVVLATITSCAPASGAGASSASTNLAGFEAALAHGQLRFEVRGLVNEGTRSPYKNTWFVHKATVIALGDTAFAKRPCLVLFAVKRLSGGDPTSTQSSEYTVQVTMQNGIGEILIPNGYRDDTDLWAPQRVEMRPIGVIPTLPILNGAVVRE